MYLTVYWRYQKWHRTLQIRMTTNQVYAWTRPVLGSANAMLLTQSFTLTVTEKGESSHLQLL